VKNNYVFPIRQVSTFRTFDTILLCNNVVMSYCHCTKDFFYPKKVLHRQKIYIMLFSSLSSIFLHATPIFTRNVFRFFYFIHLYSACIIRVYCSNILSVIAIIYHAWLIFYPYIEIKKIYIKQRLSIPFMFNFIKLYRVIQEAR